MSNIVPFEQSQLPAHLRQLAANNSLGNEALSSGVSGGYPIVSYKGKVWHISEGGVSTLVSRPGEDGIPAPYLDVVIVKANPNLSKIYYQGGYVEGSDSKPTCYSNDGIAPAADAVAKQCQTCAACPHNIWGSRISEAGGKGKSCTDARRVAIAPAGSLDYPMLLRIPAATLKDLAAYADTLSRRGVPYYAVVTRIGFDHTVAHPKFTFKSVRYLEAGEFDAVQKTAGLDVVSQIIGETANPSARAAVDQLGAAPAYLAAPQAAVQAPVATLAAPAAAPAPAPIQKPTATAAAPKPRRKATFVSEGDVGAAVAAAPAQAPAQPQYAPPAQAAPARDHSALLTAASAELDAALAEIDD